MSLVAAWKTTLENLKLAYNPQWYLELTSTSSAKGLLQHYLVRADGAEVSLNNKDFLSLAYQSIRDQVQYFSARHVDVGAVGLLQQVSGRIEETLKAYRGQADVPSTIVHELMEDFFSAYKKGMTEVSRQKAGDVTDGITALNGVALVGMLGTGVAVPAILPLTSYALWRRLEKVTYLDRAGDHELSEAMQLANRRVVDQLRDSPDLVAGAAKERAEVASMADVRVVATPDGKLGQNAQAAAAAGIDGRA